MNRKGSTGGTPACPRCGGADLTPPAPLRTSAHPNSSFLLVEMPGAHYHDYAVQARVCLSCGGLDLLLPPPTLERLKEAGPTGGGARRRAAARGKRAP
ncbi:MAG: hypothetical protein L6R43_11135 [Planctomycetes bacterium]|nr:hypothetical protein [Planctomycetota bacterium]